MKKKILGLALIASSILSFNSFAQTTNNCDPSPKQQNICGKKHAKDKCNRTSDPFNGLQLSDSQKEKLASLKEKQKAARIEKSKIAKEKRISSDSLRRAERLADRRKYLEEVKEIIGPDQYVVFLENIVVNNGKHAVNRSHSSKGNHKAHGMKHDKRHDRHVARHDERATTAKL